MNYTRTHNACVNFWDYLLLIVIVFFVLHYSTYTHKTLPSAPLVLIDRLACVQLTEPIITSNMNDYGYPKQQQKPAEPADLVVTYLFVIIG